MRRVEFGVRDRATLVDLRCIENKGDGDDNRPEGDDGYGDEKREIHGLLHLNRTARHDCIKSECSVVLLSVERPRLI